MKRKQDAGRPRPDGPAPPFAAAAAPDWSAWPVCGIDAAGRGPLAGPVYAAAVVLPPDFPLNLLDDSKRLKEGARQAAFTVIAERAWWAIDWSTPAEIDEINILQASLLAMRRAWRQLQARLPDNLRACPVLVDGNRPPDLPGGCRTVVRGDSLVPAIMAASILAKVARDRAMVRFDWLYPEYGYARHKGYPTAAHRACCLSIGPSPLQRLTFRCQV